MAEQPHETAESEAGKMQQSSMNDVVAANRPYAIRPSKEIAFSGAIGSGKSTAASFLRHQGYLQESLAAPLKNALYSIFSTTIKIENLYGSAEDKSAIIPRLGVSGRELMQVFGTELCRVELPRLLPNLQIQDNIWVDSLIDRVKRNRLSGLNTVIPDVRFENERQSLLAIGIKTVRIVREVEATSTPSHHASEQGCSFDIVVNNNCTLKEFERRVLLYCV